MASCVYAGSFDMFTYGHLSVVKQAAELFEMVHIVIAVNPNKTRRFPIELIENKIRETLENLGYSDKCIVTSFNGFVADYAKENNCEYLVRGLRNQTDYAYEEEMAVCNAVINPDVRTIYVRAENSEISSSLVYAMMKSGRDVSKFIPYELYIN